MFDLYYKIMTYLQIFLIVISIASLVLTILMLTAEWKLFSKAGEQGWKALIPFYNTYVQCKICWKPNAFWAYFVFMILTGVTTGQFSGFPFYIWVASLIGMSVVSAMMSYYVSLSYGHGLGYAIGLLLLPWLFVMILGFGSSKYVGPMGISQEKAGQ